MMIRNDIDVIGVRAGCTFTGYSDSSFNGQRMTIRAEGYDRFSMMMMMATIMMPLGTFSTNKKQENVGIFPKSGTPPTPRFGNPMFVRKKVMVYFVF